MNINNIKKEFPIFDEKIQNNDLVYLDSANSSQKPRVVIDRIYDFYSKEFSNVGRSVHYLAVAATNLYENTRTSVQKYINAKDKNEIVFTKGATEAINLVAKRSIPKNTKGVGYYFYETTKGFYFQSWENMCADYGGREKAVVQQFFYMPQNITDPEITEPKEIHDLKSVESYEFLNTFHDTAAAQAVGTYGHRVITHNLYNLSLIHI